MRVTLLVLVASLLFIIGGCKPATPTVQYAPMTTVRDVMKSIVEPSADFLWDSVGGWNDPGNYNQTLDIDHGYYWRFRLRVRKYTGAAVIGPVVELNHV